MTTSKMNKCALKQGIKQKYVEVKRFKQTNNNRKTLPSYDYMHKYI
jgi:hypothetical protein